MTDSDRRGFLKKSAAAAAALGIGGTAATTDPATASPSAADGAPSAAPGSGGGAARQDVAATLRAVGDAVLPTADLGDDGVEGVVADFEAWIEGFEPVAEMPHGYLHRGLAEIRYGPPHPGPRWTSQLEALQLEAERRHRSGFAALPRERRRELIEGQLERDEIGRLPSPGAAPHVAIGLLAFFYDGAAATDLCYRAAIGRYRCRGLSNLAREPRPLTGGEKP
jgi:hypothetical protein